MIMDRPMTVTLAGALIAVFAYEVAVGVAGHEVDLLRLGALRTLHWSAADCWRVFTFSLLHLNALHLALNVAGLVWLGGVVERRLGPIGMLAVFAVSAIVSGIFAMLLGSVLPTTGVAIGASGAIYGLLAASLMLVLGSPTRASDARWLRRALITLFVVAVIISFLPGVSVAGHFGGFIGGAVVARSIIHRC